MVLNQNTHTRREQAWNNETAITEEMRKRGVHLRKKKFISILELVIYKCL